MNVTDLKKALDNPDFVKGFNLGANIRQITEGPKPTTDEYRARIELGRPPILFFRITKTDVYYNITPKLWADLYTDPKLLTDGLLGLAAEYIEHSLLRTDKDAHMYMLNFGLLLRPKSTAPGDFNITPFCKPIYVPIHDH